jgi:hypothetical protein
VVAFLAVVHFDSSCRGKWHKLELRVDDDIVVASATSGWALRGATCRLVARARKASSQYIERGLYANTSKCDVLKGADA